MGRERYVYVEADAAGLEPIARGLRSWDEAIADGPVRVYGEPALVAALPGWFVADAAEIPILDGSGSLAPMAGSVSAASQAGDMTVEQRPAR